MNRFAETAFAVALACAVVAPAAALDQPKRSTSDHRVRYASFDPANVIQLDAVIGVATMIELEKGEQYQFHVFGDSEAYDFTFHDNYVFFKPMMDQADGNLIIITDRRNYTFRIKYHNDRNTNRTLYKLVMHYPDSDAVQTRQQARQQYVQNAFAQAGQPTNWQAYTKSGDLDLAPVHAWDDGQQTWLQFAPAAEIPVVYRVTEDSQEVLTNYHMADHRTMVLHRTSKRWHIRLGNRVVAIHNSAFGQTPATPYTGTVSPSVERIVHGVEPASLPATALVPTAPTATYPNASTLSTQANQLAPRQLKVQNGQTWMQFGPGPLPLVQPFDESGLPFQAKTTIQPDNVIVIESTAPAWQSQQGAFTHTFTTKEHLK
ncbi:TrbG/VirB9 family P-type conjugative transfer protein [Alcaligenes faecalis]|uniref:TrbG/VirB9 family P-type conjugative transfer protein n=1 Tax=Alcaligenes aquatilis TaxID=323284 RepID=UPI002AA85B9C|nr:TrbG/VirB9 family P-type conjugative transfer protein [Alcaligenes faecalis]